MPKGGVEISPFWVPMRLWHLQRLWLVWVIWFCKQVMVQVMAFMDATAFHGMLARVFGHFADFSTYLAVEWFAL